MNPDTTSNPQLNAAYLRDASNVLFSVDSIKVEFKAIKVKLPNGRWITETPPTYEGDLNGLRQHVKRHNPLFQHASVDGDKVGVFPAFKPTNKAQRLALAAATGTDEQSVKDKLFTFFSRAQALDFYRSLTSSGVKTVEKHWPYVVTTQGGSPI